MQCHIMICEKLHETDLYKKEYKMCPFCCVILHNEEDIKQITMIIVVIKKN